MPFPASPAIVLRAGQPVLASSGDGALTGGRTAGTGGVVEAR